MVTNTLTSYFQRNTTYIHIVFNCLKEKTEYYFNNASLWYLFILFWKNKGENKNIDTLIYVDKGASENVDFQILTVTSL